MLAFNFSIFTFCVAVVAAYDPVDNFCARWQHQSVIKNNRLYIDGGQELYTSGGIDQKPYVLGINYELIEVDMSASWNWKTNVSVIGIEKTANPNTGTTPPSLVRAAMYAGGSNDSNIYVFGGTTSQLNSTFWSTIPEVSTYSLWSFDTNNQVWDQTDITSEVPLRPSYGAYVDVPDQGLAFYMNGVVDDGSDLTTTGLENKTLGLTGLVVLNMTSDGVMARNLSTTTLQPAEALMSSNMVYIPQVGEKGILVEIGGAIVSATEPMVTNGTLVPFNTVNVFDIASSYDGGNGTWYQQTTTGIIPPARIDSCVVMVAAPDNSSYNIYMYDGWDPTNGTMYDDIYILSLPSFSWMKMYEGESPRWGHTCHLVGNRQLLTVGGSLSTNLTETCDWETKSVAIMDLTTKQWGSVYNADAAPYQVTSDIVAVIGGTSAGGATMQEPKNGFSDRNLKQLFATHGQSSSISSNSTATPSPSTIPTTNSKKLSSGVIGGAVVAVLFGIGIVAGVALFLVRRKRQQQIRLNSSGHDHPQSDEKNTDEYHEVMGTQTYSELAEKKHYAELAGKHDHNELPGPVPVYELSGIQSRAASRNDGLLEVNKDAVQVTEVRVEDDEKK